MLIVTARLFWSLVDARKDAVGEVAFNTFCFSSTNSVFNAMEIPKGPLHRVHSDSSIMQIDDLLLTQCQAQTGPFALLELVGQNLEEAG